MFMIPQSSLSVDGVKGHLYVTRYGVCSDLSRREIIQKGGGEKVRDLFLIRLIMLLTVYRLFAISI